MLRFVIVPDLQDLVALPRKLTEPYGLIRFGSQCDVFLPDEIVDRVLVEPGQYVLAGESVLALTRHADTCARGGIWE